MVGGQLLSELQHEVQHLSQEAPLVRYTTTSLLWLRQGAIFGSHVSFLLSFTLTCIICTLCTCIGYTVATHKYSFKLHAFFFLPHMLCVIA